MFFLTQYTFFLDFRGLSPKLAALTKIVPRPIFVVGEQHSVPRVSRVPLQCFSYDAEELGEALKIVPLFLKPSGRGAAPALPP